MYFYRCKTFARSTAGGIADFQRRNALRITRINVTDLHDLDTPAAKTQLKRGKHNIILKFDTRKTRIRVSFRNLFDLRYEILISLLFYNADSARSLQLRSDSYNIITKQCVV